MRNVIVVIASALLYAGSAHGAEQLLGFSESSSVAQRALERRYDTGIAASDIETWMRHLAAEPHHAGSAYGKQNAEYMAALFRDWGYETQLAEYEILLPTPRLRHLELVAPGSFTASLKEDTLAEDPSTAIRQDLLPPYNAFSRDGDVTAELVFVNYGIPEDYDELERFGIDVTGKIVIAKYGRSWRGIKPKLAAEKGAIGAIIYSDPADDGYGQGDVYPNGPFKHESGVQRGAVMDLPLHAGDVLTPGRAATKRARRLRREDAPGITKVPVLPISYRDALPLLQALGGPVAPQNWRGALPITYHLGPGPARVRLALEFDWNTITIYNVIARLEGAVHPDQWVLRGNHHDGWNHGARDPVSGMAALMAEAKSIAELVRQGYRPARTIVFAGWDAEEPGLIGSTEWAEEHAKELDKKAVAYLNTDGMGRGFIYIGASHTLDRFLNQVIADVDDPRTGLTLAARRRAQIRISGNEKAKKTLESRPGIAVAPLGSGSDYTPFLQHLGIASANLSLGGESANGSYHTLYDTYEHFAAHVDPGHNYGVALARVGGRATLRLAGADLLPFHFGEWADTVARYVEELVELADEQRKETEQTNQLIEDGSFAAALDSTKPYGPPKVRASVPHFNFAPLANAVARLERGAATFSELRASTDEGSLPLAQRAELDRLLFTSERLMTRPEGLPGRDWYHHFIYAPGFYTGYGVKTLPAIREAIEDRRYGEVASGVASTAEVIGAVAARIEEINALLEAHQSPSRSAALGAEIQALAHRE